MATYYDLGIADVPFKADEDLSASGNRYRFVSPTASAAGNVELATGGSLPVPMGILQNSPCSGEEAQVRWLGSSKLRVNTIQRGDTTSASTVQVGDFITVASTADGRKAGGAASPAFARALEAVSSGSAIINVYLLNSGGANVIAAS